jgi:Protein of unknown function (DUF2971)
MKRGEREPSTAMTSSYRLFKYRSLSGDNRAYTRRIIEQRRIYYASPQQFNDPFDCQFWVNMDGAPLNAFGLSKQEEIRSMAASFMSEETNKEIAVLSLTELNDNLLMWAHYADCHHGICLDLTFRTREPLHRVEYTDVRPHFYFADVREQDRDKARFGRSIISTLGTKASLWAYEKEWRCIDFGGPGERTMTEAMLNGIIFGCLMSDSDKTEVRAWVESSGQPVQFFQARQRPGEFALDVIQL